ncbi:MAG: Vitamin B12 transporter BtuB [Steroidobacteraceae bacterium]|nr:Vitamin B12 transporter BtuB [Steroidobacteraceae bacterium]
MISRTGAAGSVRVAASLLAAWGMSTSSVAQEAPPADESMALPEVVVTAQKRAENLQDVPISITAIGAEQIQSRGIAGLADLNALAPNLMFRESPGGSLISRVSIRGSFPGQVAIYGEPSVGIYLNGVYLGKSQGNIFDVVDIERVEVLRGPQGTLFGRNTEGGAINFVTRRPSGEFRGSAGVELGNLDHRAIRGSLDLPRVGIASLAFGARKQKRDGWVENLGGPDLGAQDSEAARASLMLEFSDNFNAIYDFDYSDVANTPAPIPIYALNGWRGTFPALFGPALGTAIQTALTPYATTSRPSVLDVTGAGADPLHERSKSDAHALTATWQAGDEDELKYIFARRTMRYSDQNDLDGTPLDTISLGPIVWGLHAHSSRNTHYEQDSHELQWVGHRARFKYVLGLYYFTDDGETRGSQDFSLFGSPPQRADYALGTRAKAVYSQVDYSFGDRWTATVGARYTQEEKRGWSHRFRTNGFGGAFAAEILPFIAYSEDFSATTPMVALAYRANRDLNFYGRVATGFQSGGFSPEVADPRVTTPYMPEKSVASEVGMKTSFFEGRARLNLAFYHTKITKQQMTQLLPGTTQSLMVNAGESTRKGIEVDAALSIADGWQLQLGYGYLDAKFNKYVDNALLPPLTPGGPVGIGGPLIDTASNREPPYSPKHTLNVNLEGRLLRAAWGDLRVLLDYSYTSKMHMMPVNKSLAAPNAGGQYLAGVDSVPASRNLNARLLLSDLLIGPGTMDVSLWGRNLTDEDELSSNIDFSMYRVGQFREPRTYMVTATYKW